MIRLACRRLPAFALLASTAGLGCSAPPPAAPPPAERPLTLERLYSLPRLIGTTPKGMAWAGDSRRVAFLWNDEGTNFYDVWTTDVDGAAPVRVTSLPRPDLPVPEPGADPAALRRAVAAELDPGVTAVTWHPDGTRLLFAFRGDLYLVSPGGTPASLTTTPGAEMRAAFEPGGWLAYVVDGDLWVQDLSSASPRPPAPVTKLAAPGVAVDSFRWSPDGRSLAFVETDRRGVPERGIPDYLTDETAMVTVRRAYPGEPSERRRLGVVGRDGGAVRWVDRGGDSLDPIFGYAWSPDSGRLVVDTSDLYVKDRRLLLADARSGRSTLLRREADPHNVTAQWWAGWAPDGAGVYYVSDRDEDYHVYFVDAAGGEPRRVTSGAWAVFDVTVTPRGLVIVGNPERAEERHVLRVPFDGGPPVRASSRSGTHTPVVSPDGRWAAVHFSSDEVPPDLFLTRLDGGQGSLDDERRVTTSPLPEFAEYAWVAPRYVTFPQHQDDATLHGRLMLPPGFDPARKYPAILGSVYTNTVRNQWGGRTAHPTWGLDQYLLQQGYVLLVVDISGSAGHGKAFRQRIRLDYGGIDVEDLYSGVRYLVDEGFVDPDRIGIWGSSYGGLLTTMSLFTKPGVYKAGVAGAPATNVFHALTGEMRVMMRPQDHPAEYADASSYTKAAGLEDQLLIIHGMRDRIVLFKDSVTLVEQLALHGKDVDLVALPNAEHGWDTEGLYQTRFAFRKLVEHFERYLGTGPTP